MHTVRVLFSLAFFFVVAWILGAWALFLGFIFGYMRSRLVFSIILGAAAAVVLSFFNAAQACSSGLFGPLFCGFYILGAIAWIIPALILGGIQGAIGHYVGAWASGGKLGRRRGVSNVAVGSLFLFLAIFATIFFVGLTNLATVPTISGVSPLVIILLLVGFGLYFVLKPGRRR